MRTRVPTGGHGYPNGRARPGTTGHNPARPGTVSKSILMEEDGACEVTLFFGVQLAEVYTLNTFIRFHETAESRSFAPSY